MENKHTKCACRMKKQLIQQHKPKGLCIFTELKDPRTQNQNLTCRVACGVEKSQPKWNRNQNWPIEEKNVIFFSVQQDTNRGPKVARFVAQLD